MYIPVISLCIVAFILGALFTIIALTMWALCVASSKADKQETELFEHYMEVKNDVHTDGKNKDN